MYLARLKGSLLGFFLLLFSNSLLATPEPLDLEYKLDIADYKGNTFLALMLNDGSIVKDGGLVRQMDEDYDGTEYRFPTWNEVKFALKNFDDKNANRVRNAFARDLGDLEDFTEEFTGKAFTPADITDLFKKDFFKYADNKKYSDNARTDKKRRNQAKKNVYGLGHFFAMAGGAGSLVTINDDNYFYNLGYKNGEVRSGRSYAASPVHPANDVSHKNYLKDLEKYLKGDQDRLFYTVLMQILTNSDPSQFGRLTDLGESVATDFVAVYVAELRRHLMLRLNPRRNPWENDYIESTFVGAYGSATGNIIVKVADKRGRTAKRLQKMPMWRWWEMNPRTKRSGIGKTRSERRLLTELISKYMARNHEEYVKPVLDIVGKKSRKLEDNDVFRNLAEFLNNPVAIKKGRLSSAEKKLKGRILKLGDEAEELTKATVDFLMKVQSEADEITKFAYAQRRSLRPQSGDSDWVEAQRKLRGRSVEEEELDEVKPEDVNEYDDYIGYPDEDTAWTDSDN